MEAVVTPIEVRIGRGEDIKIDAGPEVREALRRDVLRSLHDALSAIKDAEEQMPAMDDPTVRASLEYLGQGIDQAKRATWALWYLAPEYDDGGTVDE